MNKKRASEELRQWAFTRMYMGQQLKKHYQACMTEELPPRLRALVKKLDEDPQGCLSGRQRHLYRVKGTPTSGRLRFGFKSR